MNQYNVKLGVTEEGKVISEDVRAGDLQIEAGVLIFKRSLGTNEIVMAYKSWEKVMRTAKDVHDA
jgi:hypothetical protein